MADINVGIIGAGNIAFKHLDVMQDMDGVKASGIVSRTKDKAKQLAKEYKISTCADNIESLVSESKPDCLMILVSMDEIYKVCKEVIPLGLPLFIEKPAGLTPDETKELMDLAKKYNVNTMVGYNRRYYSIFQKGIEIIHNSGPLMGVKVEAHERFWKFDGQLKGPVRSQWIYANNSHMIDLMRYFGGEPTGIKSLSKNKFEKNGDQFAAIMDLDSGAIGTFLAHWYSPGGWSVTLFGEKATVEYKPLEKGWWIDRDLNEHIIEPSEEDIQYKPGFYAQMAAFISMVKNRTLEWPGQDLDSVYETMTLAQVISGAR